MEKVGCSQCKNVFSKEALENWFNQSEKKCPFRCKNAEFYEVWKMKKIKIIKIDLIISNFWYC